MIDPYEVLGVSREADGTAIKSAYRKRAKTAHPDTGGDVNLFSRLTMSFELLNDPIRRKVYDETGYDPELADTKDLQGLVILETLVNEMILDEREPGSFDPVAAMRRKLTDKVVNARFHILEMERHRARIRNHLDRMARKPGTDVLGRMLRARCQTISDAITRSETEIVNIEQAYGMLDGYAYEIDLADLKDAAE